MCTYLWLSLAFFLPLVRMFDPRWAICLKSGLVVTAHPLHVKVLEYEG